MKKSIAEFILSASESMQPIVTHLRRLVHKAEPEIEENIKWNAPSFELDGKIICNIMAFKKHVNFMFHKGKELSDWHSVLDDFGEKSNMKGIKQITDISDLPDEKTLVALIEEAVEISRQ